MSTNVKQNILETTWIIYFGLNQWIQKQLGLTDSVKPQKVFTNVYLQEETGYLKSAFPKTGKNRERDSKGGVNKCWNLHWGCLDQSAALNSSSESKHWSFVIIHNADNWLFIKLTLYLQLWISH